MLELYEFEACPFCRKVREALSILDLDVLVRSRVRRAARASSGAGAARRQGAVPYLVDPNAGLETCESDDIVRHLFARYGDGSVPASLSFMPLYFASNAVASLCRPLSGVRVRRARRRRSRSSWELRGVAVLPHRARRAVRARDPVRAAQRREDGQKRDAFVARSGKWVPYLSTPTRDAGCSSRPTSSAYLDSTYAVPASSTAPASRRRARSDDERMSIAPRLGRLLAADGRCFDVAIDHGVFNDRRSCPASRTCRRRQDHRRGAA